MLFCVGRLVTDWYARSSHSKIPVSSLDLSFALKRIETVAVHVTIGTERNGDS